VALDPKEPLAVIRSGEIEKQSERCVDSKHPSHEEQRTYYDSWNELWRAKSFDEMDDELKAKGNAVLNALSSLPFRRPTMVEVACGTGWLTERLAQLGVVTATDMSPRAIAIARQRSVEADFVAEDFYHNSLPTQYYDVAICAETIGNVPDQPLFMERIATLLKPGGYLVITAQNKFVFERRSDLESPKPGQIRQWLSRREFHQLVKRDFRILKSTTVYPCGDRGIMRAVNSYKVNRTLARFFPDGAIARAKEMLGFGASRVITAQLRDRRRSHPVDQC
jgi:2-polyprenyl-3-methyl-5-hydroxy-6-metoxy-1,4-benzoquinol methylase